MRGCLHHGTWSRPQELVKFVIGCWTRTMTISVYTKEMNVQVTMEFKVPPKKHILRPTLSTDMVQPDWWWEKQKMCYDRKDKSPWQRNVVIIKNWWIFCEKWREVKTRLIIAWARASPPHRCISQQLKQKATKHKFGTEMNSKVWRTLHQTLPQTAPEAHVLSWQTQARLHSSLGTRDSGLMHLKMSFVSHRNP